MYGTAKKIDTEEIEKGMRRQWYYVQKIMKIQVDHTFPWFVFDALWQEIQQDPEFKRKD